MAIFKERYGEKWKGVLSQVVNEATKTKTYDQSHGEPYDRGGADAWYGRGRDPHRMVQGQGRVKLTKKKDMDAYHAGYDEGPFAQKQYEETITESKVVVIHHHPEYDEYRVPNPGEKGKGAGYFTNDKQDAEDTARAIHGKDITIKHRSKHYNTEEVVNEEPNYNEIAKHLVTRYGKKVTADHIKSFQEDDKSPLNVDQLWTHIKKHQGDIKEEKIDEAKKGISWNPPEVQAKAKKEKQEAKQFSKAKREIDKLRKQGK